MRRTQAAPGAGHRINPGQPGCPALAKPTPLPVRHLLEHGNIGTLTQPVALMHQRSHQLRQSPDAMAVLPCLRKPGNQVLGQAILFGRD